MKNANLYLEGIDNVLARELDDESALIYLEDEGTQATDLYVLHRTIGKTPQRALIEVLTVLVSRPVLVVE